MFTTMFPYITRGTHVPGTWLSVLFLATLALVGCTPQSPPVHTPEQRAGSTSAPSAGRAEELFVVDCLLPGQVRKLGRQQFLTPRRPIKTIAQDCEIRGGEYVAYDRADYRTALNVWLPQAQAGDKEAQTYVGEIYEKGLGLPPDYDVAAAWYHKAAEQGHTRAQINLGHLYEKGLGVTRDPAQALQWYRRASGLQDAIALDAGSIKYSGENSNTQQELQDLRQEVQRWKGESTSLRQQLERTQQSLNQTRQELEQRQRDVEADRSTLEQTRQELDRRKQHAEAAARDDAELKLLETQLQQREAELAQRQQEVSRLQQDLVSLKHDKDTTERQLATLEQQQQQVVLAGPTIEIIDPPLVATRGLTVVKVSAEALGQTRQIVGKVTSPAGILSFTVNDREARTDTNGLFRIPIAVRAERVPVNIAVVDKQGKRDSVEFQLTAETAAAAAPVTPAVSKPKIIPAMNFGPFYALVIGNKTYTHWPSLNTPGIDARTMAEVLSKKYGFKTQLLLDATRFEILQALNELRKTLTDKDNLLVYYAGHGHWDEQIQRGYWVPVDGHTDSNVNWISTGALTDVLSAMSAKHILVVADSCYSGALTRSSLARLEAGMSDEARLHWLKALIEKRSRTVLSSGGLQPVLDTGGGMHSVFAKALLDVLINNTDILDGQRLGLEVAARVSYASAAALTQQDPQYAPLKYAGHEAGDFVFVPTTVQ